MLKQIREGQPTDNAKRDVLLGFVRKLAQSNGAVSDEDFAAIKAAVYSDAQLVKSAWLSRLPSSPTSSTASTTRRSISRSRVKPTALPIKSYMKGSRL